jgi:protein-S-isoprenylcysteine O-methyltransferase Ste14
VPWVFVLNYLLGIALHFLVPMPFSWTLAIRPDIVGGVLFILGVIVAGSGWLAFHKAGTTRVPGQVSTTFVSWGPYRFTRNPMYVGLSLAYLGEAALLRQLWPVLLLPLTLVYLQRVVIPLEETRLRETFGAAYTDYSARVRRWI